MQYRALGKTGLNVSQLGFGAMRLPMTGEGEAARVDDEAAIAMIHRAFEAGVNYIDTAVMYCNHDSQRAVGRALKGWRDQVVVSTKNHDFGEDETAWRRNLEDSLRLLDIDTIDIYNHHGVNWTGYTEAIEPRLGKWMAKARDEGLIRHICCSFHDTNEALMKLVDTGYPEVITLQYNLLDQSLAEGIAHAHERGIGVVVMGPVGGGRLGAPNQVLSGMVSWIDRVPELALRFVLSNPGVSLALSGMSTLEQVEENVAVASEPVSLGPEDRAIIDEHLERLKKMADLYCTGCKYCMPCPVDINIPVIFDLYNRARVYGLWDWAREEYPKIGKVPSMPGATAEACTECGACEDHCPQQLSIRDQLKQAHEALTGGAPQG